VLGVELVDELGEVLVDDDWSVAATLPEVELLPGEVFAVEALGVVEDELGVVLVD